MVSNMLEKIHWNERTAPMTTRHGWRTASPMSAHASQLAFQGPIEPRRISRIGIAGGCLFII
jgi:hypothetical protein